MGIELARRYDEHIYKDRTIPIHAMFEQLQLSEESPLTFPCQFPIKAMGLAADDFDLLVVEIVRRHAPDIKEAAVTSRLSRGGKYVSVTVTVDAESREQLDTVYRALHAQERVLILL